MSPDDTADPSAKAVPAAAHAHAHRVSPSSGKTADELFPKVLAELHKLARARMAAERQDHTLQATALVNEVYLKFAGDGATFQDERHFFYTAARAMREILIDHARRKGAEIHGGKRNRIEFASLLDLAALPESQKILAFDDAISRLEKYRPDAAEVVQLRFFAGCSVEQTATLMKTSRRSVDREWVFARAFLHKVLREEGWNHSPGQ